MSKRLLCMMAMCAVLIWALGVGMVFGRNGKNTMSDGVLLAEFEFQVSVFGIEGKPLKGVKIAVSDSKERKIGRYRSLASGKPVSMEIERDRDNLIWLEVSKSGYETQRFEVDLSQAGWQTTVILGKRKDHYYWSIDPAFPSGRIYPYRPIDQLVLVQGSDLTKVDSAQIKFLSTSRLWDHLPLYARTQALENETVATYNQKNFVQFNRAQLGFYTQANWESWRVSNPGIKFYPLFQFSQYGMAGFSNIAHGRIAPGTSAESVKNRIEQAGFVIFDSIDPTTGRITLLGDPSWGFEFIENLNTLIEANLFMEMNPEVVYVSCVNPPDGC